MDGRVAHRRRFTALDFGVEALPEDPNHRGLRLRLVQRFHGLTQSAQHLRSAGPVGNCEVLWLWEGRNGGFGDPGATTLMPATHRGQGNPGPGLLDF